MTEPVFFASPAELRAWFASHASTGAELLVGYWKVSTGRPSITWAQSVDEALCVGWIDGIRRSLGPDAYTIRFTPRRRGSRWSAVNVRRCGELVASGRMQPAGLAAFEARQDKEGYSYETPDATLPPEYEAALRADDAAWAFWERQPPSYRKTAAYWVTSAKQEETRQRRLAKLLAASREQRRI